MALSCDCVLTLLNLSAETCTPTETNSMMDETFELFFSTKRNVLSAEPKTKPVFSLGEPLLHLLLILLKRERCTDERERSSIFATEVTVLFVQHGFEIFQTFQKPESQVSYLPAHLQWYVFDFEIELEILIFK